MKTEKTNKTQGYSLQSFLTNNERQMIASGIISEKLVISTIGGGRQ